MKILAMVLVVLRGAEVSIQPLLQSQLYPTSLDDQRHLTTAMHPLGIECLIRPYVDS